MPAACPKCGGGNAEANTLGYLGRDMNKAWCHSCDWVGRAWELDEKERLKVKTAQEKLNDRINNGTLEARLRAFIEWSEDTIARSKLNAHYTIGYSDALSDILEFVLDREVKKE